MIYHKFRSNWLFPERPKIHKKLIVLILASVYSSLVPATESVDIKTNVASSSVIHEAKPNHWDLLHPYVAKYDFILDGDKLGQATRTLSKEDGQWRLETTANANKFLLKMRSKETSEFHIDHHQLVNDEFSSSSKITFNKTKITNQVFDWDQKTETGNKNKKKWVIPLVGQVFDRVSHLTQMRDDLQRGLKHFQYPVSHKGKIHTYTYKLDKEETLKTELGDLGTRKFVRQNSGKKTFAIWFAPELDYFPVKIAQSKKDGSRVTLLLKSLTIPM